ncbi:MAG: DUF1801 domain-containing protein [Alphaproteobacteria bacterium]|nr:DUF1801 domain-containing protein [Alphaproteobacteria bacterium]
MAAKTVDDYIASLPPEQGALVSKLRALVQAAAPGAEEAMKWAQPVFSQGGPFCYIKANKKHVNLGFWWGARLDDPAGRLEGSGDKMRHVKVQSVEDIDAAAFSAMVQQAVALNASLGDPSRTKA